ncbi:MAG: hypothetical protein NXI32_08715 [bacterium]|nr:hypothetical protein [bacterium]
MNPICLRMLLAAAICLNIGPHCFADEEATQEGDWLHKRDPDSGDVIATMRLKLHPQAEPQPALKHRLIPDLFDRKDGNAAIYYLKAMGFLEQSAAQQALYEYSRKAREQAQQEGKEVADFPPYSWLDMPVKDLPIEEVKQYLVYSSFQPAFLAEAALQKRFSLDRHIRDVENPVAYLLPEIQRMRELARKQSLRCRLAIAEGRPDDALRILGQQFALANHLGQDEFIVSTLVGAAISGIAADDAFQFVQLEDAPNLYWAIAALPDPLIDMQEAYAFERQFLYEQMKLLREVDETPRSVEYWREFMDRLIPQLKLLAIEGIYLPGLSRDVEAEITALDRAAATAFIAASYPNAKRYLIETCKMDPVQVEAYPTAQVVLLAAVKFHRLATDEYFKWTNVPFWQALENSEFRQLDSWLGEELKRIGWASAPVSWLMTAFNAARNAQYRVQQSLALLQTVEAIRMYAAENDGRLPVTLNELSVPAPIDPFTGQPIAYEFNRYNAVLNASRLPGIRYRLILEIAPQ